MYGRLSGSLPVCFLYNILVLNFPAKANQPPKKKHQKKKTQISHPTQIFIFRAACSKFCLLKKIMKISLSMTENIVTNGCFSVGEARSNYFWGCTQRRTGSQLGISHRVQPTVKKLKRYLTAWSHILIQFLLKDLFGSSPPLIVS